MDVDYVLNKIGPYGFYPLGIYFYTLFMVFTYCWQMMAHDYGKWIPEYKCIENNSLVGNDIDECKLNGTESTCQTFSFGNRPADTSTISEFNLVCDKAYLDNLCNTIFFIGIFLGNLVFGPLSDKIGRKPVFVGCSFIMAINGILTLFATSYPMYIGIRFVAGLMYAGGCFTTWTYATELFSSNYRVIPGLAIYGAWGVGLTLAAGFAYLFQKWRHLYAFLSGLAFLSFPSWFLFPESLFWLVRKGRIEEAKTNLAKIAKSRGLDLNTILAEQPSNTHLLDFPTREEKTQSDDAEENANEIKSIATSRKWSPLYILCLVVMSFLWMVDSLVYFGLQFSAQEFTKNRFLSGFIFGVIEMPAVFLAVVVVKLTTRRFSTLLFHAIGGVAMLILAVIRTFNEDALGENSPLAFSLNLIGKFGSSACFSLVNILAAELFPTNVRSTSYHIAVGCSRIAALGATFASVLFRSKPLIPEFAFGALGLLAAISAVFIPETKDQPLPQVMEDLDVMQKSTGHICKICGVGKTHRPSDEVVVTTWEEGEN